MADGAHSGGCVISIGILFFAIFFFVTDVCLGNILRNVCKMGSSAAAFSSSHKPPIRVAVTGAAGQIGYSALFSNRQVLDSVLFVSSTEELWISGEMLGKDQPIILSMIEIPAAEEKLRGVVMELRDCCFPLVTGQRFLCSRPFCFSNSLLCRIHSYL